MSLHLELTERETGILVGLAVAACNDAGRDGRTGPWVDSVRRIVAEIERAESHPLWKVRPVGGEPFGTKVTMWSTHWGTRHAIITQSPKPVADREMYDIEQWGITLRPDGMGSGGMTYAPADILTLGWHPEGDPK